MITITITTNNKKVSDKTYDKIFKIIDKHTSLFRACTENEYSTDEGYVLEFKHIPLDAIEEIENLKNVSIEL